MAARFGKTRASDPVGRVIEAVLALDDLRRLAENLGGVLAIDRDLGVAGEQSAWEFDLQVEGCACEYLRAVHRIDRLPRRRNGREGRQQRQHTD